MFSRVRISLSLSDGCCVKDNILIDQFGVVNLADFDPFTIEPETKSARRLEGGRLPWMSPELSHPKELEIATYNPTESSDCYALGMVIYEVLSGQKPFSGYKLKTVHAMIHKGERPVRPQGAEGRWFTDDIWKILKRCWEPHQSDRPRARDILQFFEAQQRREGRGWGTIPRDPLPVVRVSSLASSLFPDEKVGLSQPLPINPDVPSPP